MDADLGFALELADVADSLSLPRFRAGDLHVETKPDLTPVTDADRAVERALRERIAGARPGRRRLRRGGRGQRRRERALDPRPDRRDAELLARPPRLGDADRAGARGRMTVGVVSAPALGRRWWAARGEGAFAGGAPIRVSGIASLDSASASCSLARDLAALEPHVWHARGIGDFWQHVLVAEGALDAAVDAPLALYDYAAFAVIVEEAGGRVSAPDGGAPRPGEQVVSSNGLLHDAVLALI